MRVTAAAARFADPDVLVFIFYRFWSKAFREFLNKCAALVVHTFLSNNSGWLARYLCRCCALIEWLV